MEAKNNRFTMQKITSLYINLIPVTENAWHIHIKEEPQFRSG